jgi:hypothetical protein
MFSGSGFAVAVMLALLALGPASRSDAFDSARPRIEPLGRHDTVTGKTLKISWQRLVTTDGKTCDRCGGTEDSIAAAGQQLAAALSPLGFRVVVEKKSLGNEYFRKNTIESNRIWISDRPIEELLNAAVSSSACCGPCGDNECRIMTVGGRVYETIPPYLIVRAGLKAAADLLTPTGSEANQGGWAGTLSGSPACCPGASSCCPPARVEKSVPPAPTTTMAQEKVGALKDSRTYNVLDLVSGGSVKTRIAYPEAGTPAFRNRETTGRESPSLRFFGDRLY